MEISSEWTDEERKRLVSAIAAARIKEGKGRYKTGIAHAMFMIRTLESFETIDYLLSGNRVFLEGNREVILKLTEVVK